MKKNLLLIILFVLIGMLGYMAFFWDGKTPAFLNGKADESTHKNDPLYAKFQLLSTKGNSSCSRAFNDSISSLSSNSRIMGSCCSPMNWHRYKEQVEGLKKYKDVLVIPSDPYYIDASLAQKLKSHYEDKLSSGEQKAYDFAMENSDEKGPCCCKCWRWYVYGGLGKYLIKEMGYTGKQVTEVWNLSDGCGGEGDHVNHT